MTIPARIDLLTLAVSGCVADPDGRAREAADDPGRSLVADGRITIP